MPVDSLLFEARLNELIRSVCGTNTKSQLVPELAFRIHQKSG